MVVVVVGVVGFAGFAGLVVECAYCYNGIGLSEPYFKCSHYNFVTCIINILNKGLLRNIDSKKCLFLNIRKSISDTIFFM